MKSQLRTWGIEIDTLRSRLEKEGGQVREQLGKKLDSLRSMESDAATKLQELVKAGMPDWDNLAKRVEKTVHDIRTSLESSGSRKSSGSRSSK